MTIDGILSALSKELNHTVIRIALHPPARQHDLRPHCDRCGTTFTTPYLLLEGTTEALRWQICTSRPHCHQRKLVQDKSRANANLAREQAVIDAITLLEETP